MSDVSIQLILPKLGHVAKIKYTEIFYVNPWILKIYDLSFANLVLDVENLYLIPSIKFIQVNEDPHYS